MGTTLMKDLRLHWLEWGDPADPPFLWLHGFTGHAHTWDPVAPAVAALGYHVVAPDQRGHGDTAWHEGASRVYGSRPMVDDVGAFADDVGWDEFALLGLSMGGINAFLYAGLEPARVRRLAVLDIGPEVAAAGLARIMGNVSSGPDVFDDVDDAFARARSENPKAPLDTLRHRTEHALRPTADGRFELKYDRSLRDGTARRDDHSTEERWAAWARCTMPTLLVRGAASDVLDDDITGRMLAANPPAQLAVLEDVGHSLSLEAPTQLAETLVGWLR